MPSLFCAFRMFIGWIYSFSCGIICVIMQYLYSPKRVWDFMFKAWALGLVKIFGIKLKVSGAENIKGPAIFVMNHQSIVDVFVLPAVASKEATFLAKKEISNIPIIARAMKLGGCVFVDRKNSKNAISSIRDGLSQLGKNSSLLIFPEGTRSDGQNLLPFKKGTGHIAIESRLPIIPIGHFGMQDICPAKAWLIKPGTLHVHVGKAIDTTKWKSENIVEHTQEIFEQVKESIHLANLSS